MASRMSDEAVAKMLTAVAEVDLARRIRQQEQQRFNLTAELEKGIRDIKRQYEGASVAVTVALKQAALRQQRHDEELERLRQQRATSGTGDFQNLSRMKHEILSELQQLGVQQLASFEHMRFNHRKTLDQIASNRANLYNGGNDNSLAVDNSVISSAIISRHLPSRPPPNTPFRTRYSPAGNELSSIVSPADPEAASAHRERAQDGKTLTKQQERLRDKWKSRIEGFKQQRVAVTAGSAKSASSGRRDNEEKTSERSSSEESIAEDPEVVLAQLQARHRQSRKEQRHQKGVAKTGIPSIEAKSVAAAAQANRDAQSQQLGALAQEAATPSFDSFLFGDGVSKKAAAERKQQQLRRHVLHKRNERAQQQASSGGLQTNPFESSESDDFVVDDTFEPVPPSPKVSWRSHRPYHGAHGTKEHRPRRAAENEFESEEEDEEDEVDGSDSNSASCANGGRRPRLQDVGGNASFSLQQSQAFDDKLWEIAGLGDKVPAQMRKSGNRAPEEDNRNGYEDYGLGPRPGRANTVPAARTRDPLLVEMEAQLRAIEGGARDREARWARQFGSAAAEATPRSNGQVLSQTDESDIGTPVS
eukprot:INCI15804.1.p1 GENE.INCI15804.1~~INCI15804.1.p1  ORF type:complete len:589 (+),score=129.02 INCI15804.1:336-2102(+)